MKVFHIIEQSADQQTTEVWAQTLEQAMRIYASNALINEPIERIEWINQNTLRAYTKDEQCTLTVHNNGRIAFAKWTHNNGLY